MTADDILDALVKSAGDAIFATELAMSGGDRRCDFWTISPNGSAGFKAVAYEIKISRADYRRDHAFKQREARLFSDQFFYVTPAGLVKREEVPDWAGLIEFDGAALKKVVHAPLRDKDGPTWQFVVSLIRNSGKINRDTDLLKARLRLAERQVRDVTAALKKRGLQPWEFGILS
jgi:hypothetical protein